MEILAAIEFDYTNAMGSIDLSPGQIIVVTSNYVVLRFYRANNLKPSVISDWFILNQDGASPLYGFRVKKLRIK